MWQEFRATYGKIIGRSSDTHYEGGAVSLENVVRIEKKYSQLHSAWKMNSIPREA